MTDVSAPARRRLGWRHLIVVGLLVIFTLVLTARRDRVYQPGQTIQYDDFLFSLGGVNRSSIAGEPEGDRKPATVEYVVTLTIENRAARVPFSFSAGSVALFDPRDGRRFLVDPSAQRAYDEDAGQKLADPLVLQAGRSATRTYVFRLPADVADPRLRVAPGGWSGMLLESFLFGTKEFRLP